MMSSKRQKAIRRQRPSNLLLRVGVRMKRAPVYGSTLLLVFAKGRKKTAFGCFFYFRIIFPAVLR